MLKKLFPISLLLLLIANISSFSWPTVVVKIENIQVADNATLYVSRPSVANDPIRGFTISNLEGSYVARALIATLLNAYNNGECVIMPLDEFNVYSSGQYPPITVVKTTKLTQ